MLIHYYARIAVKTTHVDGQFPSEICITYPPHPLIGKHLKVIGRRRRGQDVLWLVVLPDGSHTHLPSCWTDHRVRRPAGVSNSSITPTTPQLLKELTGLMQALVSNSSSCEACSQNPNEGGSDERAARPLRNEQQYLGAKGVGIGRSTVAARNHRHIGTDGNSTVAGRKNRKEKSKKGEKQ